MKTENLINPVILLESLVRGDVPEAGEGVHEIPKVDNRAEGREAEEQDLEKCGSREGS